MKSLKIPKGGNQNPYRRRTGSTRAKRYQREVIRIPIEEEQAAPEPKEKVQKDKQRSTKHTHKTKDQVTIAVCLSELRNYIGN